MLTAGYREGMVVCAVLLALGGIVSWFGLRELPPEVADACTGQLAGDDAAAHRVRAAAPEPGGGAEGGLITTVPW